VAAIRQKAEIEVRASPRAAFAVVEGDILAVSEDSDAMARHRPLDAGPLREGFRWQQTIVHDRLVCRTDWVVTEIEDARVLEQTSSHLCAVAQRVVDGGERWEFSERDDGSTHVTLRCWRLSPGPRGWWGKMFGPSLPRETNFSLMKRLAYVQFAAERST
jgi:hypothetical protein